MKNILKYAKKFIYYGTPIVSALLLFITISSFGINRSILDNNFHKHVFEKNHIYTHVYDAAQKSINNFIGSILKDSPMNYGQNKELFKLLEHSITPEIIKTNLDSLREDTFQYVKGKRMFLPDIHLDSKSLENTPNVSTSSQNTLSQNTFSIEAFSKLGKLKINLSAVLLYINRSDITDWFTTLKFIYYTMSFAPMLSFLIMLVIMLIGLLCCSSKKHIRNWFRIYIFTCASLCVLSGASLIIYSIFFLPNSMKFLTMSIPIDSGILISYARDCIQYLSIFILISATLLFAAAIILKVPKRFRLNEKLPDIFSLIPIKNDTLRIIKYSTAAAMFLALFISISISLGQYQFGFEQNDFSSLLSKLGSYKVTQVISAKNDAIYSLALKVVDSKDKTALQNVSINVSGKSNITQKDFNETVLTDKEGAAKLNLDEGSFRLSFLSSNFPSGYKIPSALFFDLKSAGTTLITVNVDKIPESSKEKWGVAEIEVLDKDNNPVPNLRFAMPKETLAPGDPDSIFADTNTEGIAVFKVNQGNYKISPVEGKTPEQYQAPAPIDVTVTADTISRYTIKLVEALKKSKNDASKVVK